MAKSSNRVTGQQKGRVGGRLAASLEKMRRVIRVAVEMRLGDGRVGKDMGIVNPTARRREGAM